MAFDVDAMFITGDLRILLGDGVTPVTVPPTPEAIADFISDGTPITGLIDLGDTKIDEVISWEQDEATRETKGTLQHRILRDRETAPAVDRWAINSVQPRDGRVMELYYGGGTEGDGYFDAPASSTEYILPALLIFKDGNELFPAYIPNNSVRGNGPLSFPMDDYVEVPLAGTVLSQTTPKIRWYSDTFEAP